ncbi:DUF6361 family protein [Desulfovibrio sp. ZJ200]|uniref:DUF6361 family protein n=1 Tax=Desulfovibrio sp. ZJ200 TaxID=2709792 RepID=UPI0013EA29B1|nr:DUF6361 family protein [Desulfovibrio sp. ZJ200]
MPLGWIDFSKTERNKVLSVLDMLSESGTLDELGIAPIRDGFANLFFPGTSTIQTRAKYFLIVPYALKELEHSPEANPTKVLRAFDEIERSCGQMFLQQSSSETGIIGRRSLRGGRWVKRTPADIYWAGLRQYGIFTAGNLSLTEYVRASCAEKKQKQTLRRLGNRRDGAGENETDDRDAGDYPRTRFWNLPLYREDWMDSLEMKLTQEEGAFLKERIIAACPGSMLAFILKNNRREVLELENFQSLAASMDTFPVQMRADYALALDFSDFLLVLRTVYNMIVSQGENADANRLWTEFTPSLRELASVDLEAIFVRLQITDPRLRGFMIRTKKLMETEYLDGLKQEVVRREEQLKGPARAKTRHPEQFDHSQWYGGGALDYRFGNARMILRDIFESEGAPC